ncbi:MAG: glycoside hydrolase family 30 beta sandwich domain-containing protein [Chitinophagales bacterium]
MKTYSALLIFLSSLAFLFSQCAKSSSGNTNPGDTTVVTPPDIKNEVDFWLTTADQSVRLTKQNTVLGFGTKTNAFPNIDVDSSAAFQSIDGFGYTLTGGSAALINAMSANTRSTLLQELFGKNDNSIGISYLRISIGASDLNAEPFTYDDVAAGQTDIPLANFNLDGDLAGGTGLIPLLKEIIAIQPSIKIIATPWTAPVWMKDNNNFKGGSLLPAYYTVYAQYFVKYIQAMQTAGITIDAITPQNEPLNPDNTPSLYMTAEEEAEFIKTDLGPAFHTAGLTTKIIIYDHNCDKPEYPLAILNDAAALPFVNGSAFHLYAGDISALSTVHDAFPGKAIYFTEQYTASTGAFAGDLAWHLKNVVIGSMRNWSRVALEWNLANDPNFNPHTIGGCNTCKGALTINGETVSRNVAYYIIAHASKFVPAGSVRITSNITGGLYNVAFLRPDGKKVLIVFNDNSSAASFNIRFKNKWVSPQLAAGSVGSFVW